MTFYHFQTSGSLRQACTWSNPDSVVCKCCSFTPAAGDRCLKRQASNPNLDRLRLSQSQVIVRAQRDLNETNQPVATACCTDQDVPSTSMCMPTFPQALLLQPVAMLQGRRSGWAQAPPGTLLVQSVQRTRHSFQLLTLGLLGGFKALTLLQHNMKHHKHTVVMIAVGEMAALHQHHKQQPVQPPHRRQMTCNTVRHALSPPQRPSG